MANDQPTADSAAQIKADLNAAQAKLDALKSQIAAKEGHLSKVEKELSSMGAVVGIWQHRQNHAALWSQHFSTVRMTVTPFLFTTSLGVLAFKWKAKGFVFDYLSIGVWCFAVWLLIVFTYFTHRFGRLDHLYGALIPKADEKSAAMIGDCGGFPWHWWRKCWLLDQGLLIGLLLTAMYGSAVYAKWHPATPWVKWLNMDQRDPKQKSLKVHAPATMSTFLGGPPRESPH